MFHKPENKNILRNFDRRNKFVIEAKINKSGLPLYQLENRGMTEKIFIERCIFDAFRRKIRSYLYQDKIHLNEDISFKGRQYLNIDIDFSRSHQITITEKNPGPRSTKNLSLKWEALPTFLDLLYHQDLGHPNDALDLITEYHRMFQFTFQEGSESITSDLTIRRDILSQIDRYTPGLAQKSSHNTLKTPKNIADNSASKAKKPNYVYKPKLGDRDHHRKHRVDYESLFRPTKNIEKTPKTAEDIKDDSKGLGTKTAFPLPIMTGSIKQLSESQLSCQFSQEEIHDLRSHFIQDRSSDFFIGIEILDCIFRKGSGLKTFRFPLYYLQVEIEEAGREIILHPKDNAAIFINHLALANLLDNFVSLSAGTGSPVSNFFKTMLAQTLKINNRHDRIRLKRNLPVAEEVFEKTREILLGFEGENGKGGLLSHLKVIGIEVDLDAVFLYKAPRNDAPLVKALDADLKNILAIAKKSPNRFYESLLGQFLTPEMREVKKSKKFIKTPTLPGPMPKVTRNLLEKLDKHDLVLLEGPPGTGKTYTIMNLFLHCLNTGQRLLVVSDQEAAIHALEEKIQEYLYGSKRDSVSAKNLNYILQCAIKVVDKAPLSENSLLQWVRSLQHELKLEDPLIQEWPSANKDFLSELEKIDHRIQKFKNHIQDIMNERLGENSDYMKRVSPRRRHATTVADINDLVAFLQFVHDQSGGIQRIYNLARFIDDRENILHSDFRPAYGFFRIPNDLHHYHGVLAHIIKALDIILAAKPNSQNALTPCLSSILPEELSVVIRDWFAKEFPKTKKKWLRSWQIIRAIFKNKATIKVAALKDLIKNQLMITTDLREMDPAIRSQLNTIHHALELPETSEVPLCLEISRFAIESIKSLPKSARANFNPSIQESLNEISRLQDLRDEKIKENIIGRLGDIGNQAFSGTSSGDPSAATRIGAILDNLKTYNTVHEAQETLNEFRDLLFQTFPIWICRKQAVSFLFPCMENSFDLVIIDEATQCRVDDALPLLFRGQKIMVVGDEKQTVLAKNSILDDYLFEEFDLKEHLRNSQASAIKGGGSHIFGLVKNIKQASIMLDEHYRCPPDIIAFSNKYVYNSELKTMQWSTFKSGSTVTVDFSEQDKKHSEKQFSGKYKGIETLMIDRFLDFVTDKIREIEQQTGNRINVETDVALCYFLLKNEPYIKDVKSKFLQKLARGENILDGAGAALQGKERDYIFYLWDINRGNLAAFRQGDDPDKRKGELNVLMSRPKKKAFHFLHGQFADLDHKSSTITDYLWNTYNSSQSTAQQGQYTPRTERPGKAFLPWRRSSGSLMENILRSTFKEIKGGGNNLGNQYSYQHGVSVGNPQQRIDLVLNKVNDNSSSIAIVDLCGFDRMENCANEIVDYYFQLKRATPKIEPFFMFMHELASPKTRAYRLLKEAIIKRNKKNDHKKVI